MSERRPGFRAGAARVKLAPPLCGPAVPERNAKCGTWACPGSCARPGRIEAAGGCDVTSRFGRGPRTVPAHAPVPSGCAARVVPTGGRKGACRREKNNGKSSPGSCAGSARMRRLRRTAGGRGQRKKMRKKYSWAPQRPGGTAWLPRQAAPGAPPG